MTLPKKGSRRIVVDGHEYRWTVRISDNFYVTPCRLETWVVVEAEGPPRKTLKVDLADVEFETLDTDRTKVTPLMVANIIEAAHGEGWPDAHGRLWRRGWLGTAFVADEEKVAVLSPARKPEVCPPGRKSCRRCQFVQFEVADTCPSCGLERWWDQALCPYGPKTCHRCGGESFEVVPDCPRCEAPNWWTSGA